jgi:hypothetical protein
MMRGMTILGNWTRGNMIVRRKRMMSVVEWAKSKRDLMMRIMQTRWGRCWMVVSVLMAEMVVP